MRSPLRPEPASVSTAVCSLSAPSSFAQRKLEFGLGLGERDSARPESGAGSRARRQIVDVELGLACVNDVYV